MTKILIVEDEPGIYTFLKEGLIDEGYDTLVATDGSEALRDFADWKPDLVLLDWMLPTMDGIEVRRSIRETDVTTPVLFLTAKDGVEDTIKGLRTGANDYIKKPFSFEELVERIKHQIVALVHTKRLIYLLSVKVVTINIEAQRTGTI